MNARSDGFCVAIPLELRLAPKTSPSAAKKTTEMESTRQLCNPSLLSTPCISLSPTSRYFQRNEEGSKAPGILLVSWTNRPLRESLSSL